MRIFFLFFFALGATVSFSQNKQLLYGFDEIPQSLLLNPGAKVSQKGHIGIPFLSQIHLNVGTSGVTVFDIFGESNVDINTRIRNKIFEMKDSDFFTATQQLDILNFGWKSKKDYYFSGGVYQEFDFISYFPRDLAILAWEGNRDYIGYEFDLGQVSTTGDVLTVYHFGANKQVGKKLAVGARAKLYSSIASFRSVDNRGTFVTPLGDGDVNIYEHTLTNVNVQVETSGIADLDEGSIASKTVGRALLGGNLGLGLDLGATYDISESFTASASILDLGMVFHTKNVEAYRATGDYTLDGIELIFPPFADSQGTLPYYDDLEDEIEREIPIDTLTGRYTQLRPVKLNASLRYNFGNRVGRGGPCDCRNGGAAEITEQAVGIHLFGMDRPKRMQTAATVYYYRRLWDFLSAKATYTIDPYSSSNVGLGISSRFGKFNFYVAADNLLHYGNLAKANNVSLQLGFNIIFDEE
ncbi:MAG: hypothetical protein CMC08_02805 [Flavobacteriaceae bacterium]|nr:hypothetical protein [Flavobacteriaceae bacterium]